MFIKIDNKESKRVKLPTGRAYFQGEIAKELIANIGRTPVIKEYSTDLCKNDHKP